MSDISTALCAWNSKNVIVSQVPHKQNFYGIIICAQLNNLLRKCHKLQVSSLRVILSKLSPKMCKLFVQTSVI